jgi:hypothetical protein
MGIRQSSNGATLYTRIDPKAKMAIKALANDPSTEYDTITEASRAVIHREIGVEGGN